MARQWREKKHQQESEAIPVQNSTDTTPHPIETPEEGRTEVPGTPREQAEGEE